MQIKEVLKQTAERRGPASNPTVDPYWNRDFGYGMVDARAAVELAFYLAETNQSTSIDWTIQNHLLNVTNEGGKTTISGHAWTQSDVLAAVQYRIGEGTWKEATYEVVLEELGPLTPFNWTVALDLSSVPAGEQTVEIRAIRGAQQSLPVLVEVTGSDSSSASGLSMVFIIGGSLVLVAILGAFIGFIMMRQGSAMQGDGEEIFEAELLPDEDLSTLTVAELKKRLSEQGLPVSGNKSELIARLSTQTA